MCVCVCVCDKAMSRSIPLRLPALHWSLQSRRIHNQTRTILRDMRDNTAGIYLFARLSCAADRISTVLWRRDRQTDRQTDTCLQ